MPKLGGGGGIFFWMGMCGPDPEPLTYFRGKF